MSQTTYLKKFEIRWSDLDANRHLANSSYMNFMSATRMAYLQEHGFGFQEMAKHNLGPVIFNEQIHYFKEIFPGKPVFVSLMTKGLSKDGMFFQFVHGFYNSEGKQLAAGEVLGGMIDLNTRKLISLPQELIDQVFDKIEKTSDFIWLTKEDTRKNQRIPQDITIPK